MIRNYAALLTGCAFALLLGFRLVDTTGRYVLHQAGQAEVLLVLLGLIASIALAGRASGRIERQGA